jgi:hypothetical protein
MAVIPFETATPAVELDLHHQIRDVAEGEVVSYTAITGWRHDRQR